MRTVLVVYVPVLHEGYRALFSRHPEATELYLFGSDVIGEFEHLIKDIRKLDPLLTQKAVASWAMFDRVSILNASTIEELRSQNVSLVCSNDDITRELVQKYFSSNPVTLDNIFLRWDKKTAMEPMAVSPDVTISTSEFDKQMIATAQKEGEQSPDWWRRLGAIAVLDGRVLVKTHNTYVPSEQIAYNEGDPRSNFRSGVNLESSLAIHAEARLVSLAAKDGISLKGASVYVDTFPCPPCAKMLAYSGITKLYYRTGYKVLDGERILRSQGIEIIFVS
ncbi:MAG: deaminase [Patescibacteria group bacterium]|jgi:dCMP deaminase